MASTYFNDQWLWMEAYNEWLLRCDDYASAKCIVCLIPSNKIGLSSTGERAIKSHTKGKKHCNTLVLCLQRSRIKFMPVSKGSSKSQVTWCIFYIYLFKYFGYICSTGSSRRC